MTTVVEFRRPARKQGRSAAGTEGSADIVFFPGVRYEREEPSAGTPRKKAKRRRDTLHLES
jgi:hypothetical protein